jgi:hypothetical protein
VPVFLHSRVETAARLGELASARAEEGQYLEFKPNISQATFRFPIPGRAHSILSFEEIMRSHDSRRRSMYLRLREFVPTDRNPADVLFRFYSPLHGRAGGFEPADIDGTILELTPDVLVLSIHGRQEFWLPAPGDVIRTIEVPTRKVAVPLELVLAASRDPRVAVGVAITLTVPLKWDGHSWMFLLPARSA